ncbi:27566_t:CDS:2, partial [Racocetra persica]
MLPNPMKSDSPDDHKIPIVATSQDDIEIPIVASSQDDIDEAFKQIKESNLEYLLGSDGKFIKQNKIYDWLKLNENDDKLVDNIRMKSIRPLYEILEEELRHQVDVVWKNRLDDRILLTGFTNISEDNLTEARKDNLTEAHIRINFKDRLDDNCFHVFGHVVNDDHDKIEGIVVRFDLFDYYGFSAFVTFNQSVTKNIKECLDHWGFSAQVDSNNLIHISLSATKMTKNHIVLLIATHDIPFNDPPTLSFNVQEWSENVLCLK